MAIVRITRSGIRSLINLSLIVAGGVLLFIAILFPRLFGVHGSDSAYLGAETAYADAPNVGNCSCDVYHDGVNCSGGGGGGCDGGGCAGSCY